MTVFFDTIAIELYNGSAWLDLSADVLSNPRPRGERGIKGSGPTDCVEDPGKFTFSLNNGENNSQGELGYYSIGAGRLLLRIGAPVRVGFTYNNVTKYKWAGYVEPDGATVTTSPTGARRVDVVCQNWFALINTYDLDFLQYTTNKRIEEAVELIIQELPTTLQPAYKEYATG
jgi:hypothetical protein